ncbi:MAG: efflux RND transporter periplasmic adaptor subunit [Deltaproteobacteria bacterium]
MSNNAKNARRRSALKVIIPAAVIVVGFSLAAALIKTSPKIERKSPEKQARLVEVARVYARDENTFQEAMGEVKPAEEVALHPQVAGKIVEVSREFIPGGRFRRGEVLLRIERSDYELAARQRESEVAQAQSDLKLEMGQQAVALKEYELLGEVVSEGDRDFVLRKPQLEKTRSVLNSAKAALALAKINIERTAVKAPFDLIITGRGVNLGAQVAASTPLATIVGTDRYWVEAPVPVDALRWIQIPNSTAEAGSRVKIFSDSAWGKGVFREGEIVRLLGDLERESRMARVIVEIADPLSLSSGNRGKPRLIIGSYVRLEIEGQELKSVFSVDRRFVHNGGQVWIMNAGDELEIRQVGVLFRGRDKLYINEGLSDGERLVTTLLSTPVEGMKLRTRGNSPSEPVSRSTEIPAAEVKTK